MYHHVCPTAAIPRQHSAIEGWQYCISPEQLRLQLQRVQWHGWSFVSLASYVAGLADGSTQSRRLAAVTFDDAWRDNYEFALPVLVDMQVPATIFAVSGLIPGVSSDRRMSCQQLRSLAEHQVSVGAHSRTHPRLTTLSEAELEAEVQGSRRELQDLTGTGVDFFAYPGGRFNQTVVRAVQSAGYTAACSVIGLARNHQGSRYWLYRDVLTDSCDSWRDRLKLSAAFRSCVGWRATRRVRVALSSGTIQ